MSNGPKANGSKVFWMLAAVVAAVVVVVGGALLVWRPWRDGATEGPTTTTAPVALPDEMPTNSGCRGNVIAHQDIEHKWLGPVRIFLTLGEESTAARGCVAAVTASGKVLPPLRVDVSGHFGFPSPATDATGNTFVTYNPGRYDGVLVLVPTPDGFEDIGWSDASGDTHYRGRFAIYYAELVGPGPNGQYTIRQSTNDCTPSCAEGTVTHRDLHWNGTDYVP